MYVLSLYCCTKVYYLRYQCVIHSSFWPLVCICYCFSVKVNHSAKTERADFY